MFMNPRLENYVLYTEGGPGIILKEYRRVREEGMEGVMLLS
jgi:hypothetical protein